MKLIIRLMVLIASMHSAFAQLDSIICTAAEVANIPGINNIPWSVSSNNSTADDMVYQSITLNNAIPNCISDTLVLRNFNGTLPLHARITGIRISILKSSSVTALVNDQFVGLSLPGKGKQSPNKRINLQWPQGSVVYGHYGNSNDLWSIDWELSDFADPDLEIRFVSTTNTNSTGNVNIDYVRMIVYYTLKEIPLSSDPGPHVFYPMNTNLDQSTFIITEPGLARIFDKWGTLIRELQSPAEWDGTDAKGNLVPSGVYFLYINEKEKITVTVLK